MTTAVMPRTPDEFADAIYTASEGGADPHGITRDRENLRAFAQRYAAEHANRETMEQQVAEQVQREFAALFRANGLGDIPGMINRLNLDPNSPAVPRSRHYNAKAPGARLDGMFSGWGEYLRATWGGNNTGSGIEARTKIQEIQNTFGSSVPSDGGFLLAPEALRAELLRVALELAMVRPRARVVPMETLTIHYPMIDSTSNASSVHGGITGYWVEDGADMTPSSASFGQLELRARMLTLYSEIPNTLFTDSLISLQQFMDESYPEALAWFEDIAFISGDGVGKPLGFLNSTAAVSVAKETSQAAASIVWANIVKAFSRMMPASLGRAVWVANIDTFPALATMSQAVGTGGSLVWIGEGQGAGAPPVTILGRPVLFTEKVSTLGTVGDINFVDFGYYVIGDRQVMQTDTSTHYKFGSNKTAMRVIERVDGQSWIKSAITPQTGSNTLSPFVKIATRA